MYRKYSSALACGFGAAALSIVPGLKIVACCLTIPAAAILSIFLYQKINHTEGKVNTNIAFLLGLFTGFFAGLFSTFFELLLTYLTHSNDFVVTFPQTEALLREYNLGPMLDQSMELLRKMIKEIKNDGFSALYSIGIFFSNVIIDTIFGMIGGLLGMLFINKKHGTNKMNPQ
jgi:hypothetical protein